MNSCIIAITPPRHETLTDLAEAEDPILGRHFPLQTGAHAVHQHWYHEAQFSTFSKRRV